MKRLFPLCLFAFLLSVDAEASVADCTNRLVSTGNFDSQSFQLDLDDYDIRDYGRDHVAFAIRIVREVLEDVGCGPQIVNFGRGPWGRSQQSCRELVPGREVSRVCYIETNLGAFIITFDYFTQVYVIYKRWD